MISSRLGAHAAAAVLVVSCACVRDVATVTVPEPDGIRIEAGRCVDALPDTDRDGLADACELALARAFAPLLMTHATRCTPPSSTPAARIPGGYFHAAQPVRGGVHLVYMPAYYRDCGWTGAKCILMDCRGHAGDSELIVVHARQTASGAWYTEAVFLSAHCFGRMPWNCRWYREDDLDAFAWLGGVERGAPVVWVSDARNANYPSAGACERGHLGFDRCDRSALEYRFPITSSRDIGSRAAPLEQPGQPPGCVTGEYVEPIDWLLASPSALECFWDPAARFRGWQGAGPGATAYGAYLEHLGL
ncbi:MAG TPA: hypothetical protein VFZ69_04485 [Longimicrobiales bacterium]